MTLGRFLPAEAYAHHPRPLSLPADAATQQYDMQALPFEGFTSVEIDRVARKQKRPRKNRIGRVFKPGKMGANYSDP